jgi:mannose-6-phosphate isomerase-like protein (cupin superfamily)
MSGPVERNGDSDAKGGLSFDNLRPGTYRLRFEREGYITLEREATIPAKGPAAAVDVALSSAPPVAPVAPPPPPPAPERSEPPRPVGEARTLQVPAFAESNFIGRGEPQKLSVVGCTGYATTRILQVREPMTDRVNEHADETLYVVAGDASVRLGGADRQIDPGALAIIPRGTTHTISRRGRNPAILVSVLSGPPCQGMASK